MNAEWFAGRLRELRESRGWTQQQLADASGVKIGGVRDIEQGRNKPTWDTVLALCQALGVTPDTFTKEPAARLDTKPGRPRKVPTEAEVADKPAPKRKRKK